MDRHSQSSSTRQYTQSLFGTHDLPFHLALANNQISSWVTPSTNASDSTRSASLLTTFTAATTPEDQFLEVRSANGLSPGLEARLRRLHLQRQSSREEVALRRILGQESVGRIPEQQLAELERLHWSCEGTIERAPRSRNTSASSKFTAEVEERSARMPRLGGGVRLSGGPVLTDNEASGLSAIETDDAASSIIDISDAFVAGSDSEFDEHLSREASLVDSHKYRMPDIGKTRLCLRTKEPLSPSPNLAANVLDWREGDMEQRIETELQTPRSEVPNGDSHGAIAGPDIEPQNLWNIGMRSTDTLQRNASDSDISVRRPSLSRAGSVYTLGRASFTGQLAQLTAMRLPDADSLAKRISALPSALEAAKALSDASEQIRLWIAKATDVLDGLNAEDDVEWAAAGGKEGIEDVDMAINRFQRLVEIYILSIERLQTRDDVAQLSAEEIQKSVDQMETIMTSWKGIKDTLKGVKDQVEIAMEWQRLWDSTLGEVAQEMDSLHRLVFEMEERRHAGSESVLSSRDSIDISELETIVEEQPGRRNLQQNRLSIAAAYLSGPSMTPPPNSPTINKEDSSLLALFARMQPLRASLDFLPMKLSSFQIRGSSIFPSACEDLDQRKEQLESQWKKLEADAESLRRELGEDRWVTVFRNAGRQAIKMCESITRSVQKLKDAIDANEQHASPSAVQNKIENYEQKKRHYGPAIERVLAIIDRGVTERLTVNGEILRLQSDMKRRWAALQVDMVQLDVVVTDLREDPARAESQDKHLRDSVSTVVSTERSIASSLGAETPGSSPASSVIVTSRKDSFESRTPTPLTNIKLRSSSSKPDRFSLTPSSIPRKSFGLRHKSSLAELATPPARRVSSLQTPPKQPAWPSRPDAPVVANKPRFSSAAKTESRDFKPLSAYEPSPYAKAPTTPKHNYLKSGQLSASTSRVPANTSRISSAPSPAPALPRPATSMSSLRKSSLPVPTLNTPSKQPVTGMRRSLNSKASAPALRSSFGLLHRTNTPSGRMSSMLPTREESIDEGVSGNEADSEAPAHHRGVLNIANGRQSAASGRRSSFLPSRAGARSRLDYEDSGAGAERPLWRP